MNEQGQLLLIDALLSLLLVFIVITAMFYVLNQEKVFTRDNNEAYDKLNLLSSYSTNGRNIITGLMEGDSYSKEVVSDILSDYEYELYDLSTNQSITVRYSGEHKNSISAKKIIGEHEFRLTLYY